jgi:hypothetical protein
MVRECVPVVDLAACSARIHGASPEYLSSQMRRGSLIFRRQFEVPWMPFGERIF